MTRVLEIGAGLWGGGGRGAGVATTVTTPSFRLALQPSPHYDQDTTGRPCGLVVTLECSY